jgi:hypothetical protein
MPSGSIPRFEVSDRELMDIGTTRGEIDYVGSHKVAGNLWCLRPNIS